MSLQLLFGEALAAFLGFLIARLTLSGAFSGCVLPSLLLPEGPQSTPAALFVFAERVLCPAQSCSFAVALGPAKVGMVLPFSRYQN